MGAIKGDFAKLERLAEQAAKLGSGDLIRRSAHAARDVFADLAIRGASAGVAPSGHRWKPKKGGGQALRGAAGALSTSVEASTVTLLESQSWLRFHQFGGRSRRSRFKTQGELKRKSGSLTKPVWVLPRRRMLPARKLPKRWALPLLEALEREWLRTFS